MKNQRFLTATHILSMNEPLPDQSVLVFEDTCLMDILEKGEIDPAKVEEYNGTLIPGFVNAHCHLELSHMKGKIDPGTGLISFLHEVVSQDPVSEEIILDAIKEADQEMSEAGIVAVGDISNLPYTANVKMDSPIAYYTFVEMFDFLDPSKANHFYNQYESVYHIFRDHGLQHVTRVPHSPYTVSRKLQRKLVNALSPGETGTIHMLENEQEELLMMGKKSEYPSFFEGVGFGLTHFQAPGHGSLQEFMDSGYHPERMLFVHNTVAGEVDLNLIKQYGKTGEAYLVTCPNANLYIESRLPDYELWKKSGLPICIGTDSYASNDQLSIWEEVCAIKSNNGVLSWEEVLRWATWNGARALGMDDKLGSIEQGKYPGLVLLEHRKEGQINLDTTLRKIL